MEQVYSEIKRQRKRLILGLVTSIFAINLVVFLSAGSEIEIFVSDLSRVGTISAAAIMSMVIVVRQKTSGLFGRAYASLAAGSILWVAAEAMWGYFEVGLQEERPFPSLADALWLAGYGPIGYHMISTAKFFGKG